MWFPSMGPASCRLSGVYHFEVFTRGLFCRLCTRVTSVRRRNYPQFNIFGLYFSGRLSVKNVKVCLFAGRSRKNVSKKNVGSWERYFSRLHRASKCQTLYCPTVKITKAAATCFGSHKTIIREPHPVLS